MVKIFLAISIIFTDQLLKYLLVNGYINSVYYKNFGAGLSLFKNEEFIILTSMILSFVLLIYLYKNISSYYYKLGLVFLLSGGMSNFIDRVRFSYVIDYINLNNYLYINFADIFIFSGFILVLINMFLKSDFKKE